MCTCSWWAILILMWAEYCCCTFVHKNWIGCDSYRDRLQQDFATLLQEYVLISFHHIHNHECFQKNTWFFLTLTTVFQALGLITQKNFSPCQKISKECTWFCTFESRTSSSSSSHYDINIKISWYFTPEIFGEVTDAYLESLLKKKPCWPGHLIDGTDQESPCLAYRQIIWIPDLMHRSQNLSQEVIGKNWHTNSMMVLCKNARKILLMILILVDCRF